MKKLSIIFVLAAMAASACRPEPQVRAQLVAVGGDPSGFSRADGPRPLAFPTDHGPHPDFQSEWWYYTGNLDAADGRHFGYQLTFFRRALLPAAERQLRASDLATEQLYLAHFSLTDVDGGEYRAFERFSRGAGGLAGAAASPYRVWLEDWRVETIAPHAIQLYAVQDDILIDLILIDAKGPVLQGDHGYSQKGPASGNASYYFSQTRLQTDGTISVRGDAFEVSGLSWMDHEFSTSALASDQVGWDWFSVQLDDGSELMVFQLRKEDGSVDPFSSGAYIAPDGSTTPLTRDDFEIVVGATWRSPRSGAEYPAQWSVRVPRLDLQLEIEPHLTDQELNVSFVYWEGAVRITGRRAGRAVAGNGYVELTGYAASMQGQF
ncbi:MAG: lipocalin-like domain-containing protein [Anaerolineales bacterium]